MSVALSSWGVRGGRDLPSSARSAPASVSRRKAVETSTSWHESPSRLGYSTAEIRVTRTTRHVTSDRGHPPQLHHRRSRRQSLSNHARGAVSPSRSISGRTMAGSGSLQRRSTISARRCRTRLSTRRATRAFGRRRRLSDMTGCEGLRERQTFGDRRMAMVELTASARSGVPRPADSTTPIAARTPSTFSSYRAQRSACRSCHRDCASHGRHDRPDAARDGR